MSLLFLRVNTDSWNSDCTYEISAWYNNKLSWIQHFSFHIAELYVVESTNTPSLFSTFTLWTYRNPTLNEL